MGKSFDLQFSDMTSRMLLSILYFQQIMIPYLFLFWCTTFFVFSSFDDLFPLGMYMWSRYLVNSSQGQLTLYYEPHCVYNESFVEKERADIVITPVIKQLLPKFTLVSGQEDAVQLAKLLHAKYATNLSL